MTGLDPLRRIADRLCRSEYTGENRCLPHTVLNAAIVGVVAIAFSPVIRPVTVCVQFARAGDSYNALRTDHVV